MRTPRSERQPHGALHGLLVARVPAAGDVGRRDVLHQRRFVRRVFQFPHVAIQVDLHSEYNHSSWSRSRPSAPSMVIAFEADLVARAQLAQPPEIRGDHVGRLGIAAGGLVLHEEHDRLSVRRRLHRAQRHSFGDHVAARRRQRRPLQPDSHAIGFLAHPVARRRKVRRRTSAPAARRWPAGRPSP